MGASRRNMSLFKFIRKFRGVSGRSGYLHTGVYRQKLVELINFARVGLRSEFLRLNHYFLIEGRRTKLAAFVGYFKRKKKSFRVYEMLKKQKSGVFVAAKRKTKIHTFYPVGSVSLFHRWLSYYGVKRAGLFEKKESSGINKRLVVVRFIVRLLGLLVVEPRLCLTFVNKFPGLVLGLLAVVSKNWRFLLQNSSIIGWDRFKLSVRGRQLRKRLLGGRSLVGRPRMSFALQRLRRIQYRARNGLFGRWRQTKSRWRRKRRGRLIRLFEFRRKLQRFWGGLTLRQLWEYRGRAKIHLRGLWDRYALGLFECRLDVFLVRIGFVDKISDARLYIKNGLVLINGLSKTFYRYAIGGGDSVQLRPQQIKEFQLLWLQRLWGSLNELEGSGRFRIFPVYLEFSFKRLVGCLVGAKFSLQNLVHLVRFDSSYAVNCGRFQF